MEKSDFFPIKEMRPKFELLNFRGIPFWKIEKAKRKYTQFKKTQEPIRKIHTIIINFLDLGNNFWEANFYLENELIFKMKI